MRKIHSGKPLPTSRVGLVPLELREYSDDVNGYYELLGLPVNASNNDIRRKFRQMARELHPDHGGNIDSFVELNTIVELLLDPMKRYEYTVMEELDEYEFVEEIDEFPHAYYTDSTENDDLVMQWIEIIIDLLHKYRVECDIIIVYGSNLEVERNGEYFLAHVNDVPSKDNMEKLIQLNLRSSNERSA